MTYAKLGLLALSISNLLWLYRVQLFTGRPCNAVHSSTPTAGDSALGGAKVVVWSLLSSPCPGFYFLSGIFISMFYLISRATRARAVHFVGCRCSCAQPPLPPSSSLALAADVSAHLLVRAVSHRYLSPPRHEADPAQS